MKKYKKLIKLTSALLLISCLLMGCNKNPGTPAEGSNGGNKNENSTLTPTAEGATGGIKENNTSMDPGETKAPNQESENQGSTEAIPSEQPATEESLDPDDPGYNQFDLTGLGFGDAVLTEDEAKEIASKLEKNQLYIYDSDSSDLDAKIITFDESILKPEALVNDYTSYLSIEGFENSRVLLVYDTYDASSTLNFYVSTLSSTANIKEGSATTDLGQIKYFTNGELSIENYYEYYYALDVTNDSSLNGCIYVAPSEKSKIKIADILKALFVKID